MGELANRERMSIPVRNDIAAALREYSKESGVPMSRIVEKALLAVDEITSQMEVTMMNEMEKKYGAVEFEGKKYILTDQAYPDNYGTNGEVRYRANAIGEAGSEFYVVWQTTQQWDDACELANLESRETGDNARWNPLSEEERERLEDLQKIVHTDCEDESNACDWDSPIAVQER